MKRIKYVKEIDLIKYTQNIRNIIAKKQEFLAIHDNEPPEIVGFYNDKKKKK